MTASRSNKGGNFTKISAARSATVSADDLPPPSVCRGNVSRIQSKSCNQRKDMNK